MRVLVVTVVHDPRDARIAARQIPALLAAGDQVTFAAPFRAYGTVPPPGVTPIDLPAARDRDRVGAIRQARSLLRRRAGDFDVVLLHDPELLIAAAGISHPAIVWDVHEDTAAAVSLKPWLPNPLRPPVARIVTTVERWAERTRPLLLAEDDYAHRFRRGHPVVPNSPIVPDQVPPSGPGRAVFVGHLTVARGARVLLDVGRLLAPHIRVDVVGHAHPALHDDLRAASERGEIHWHGFVPNAEALDLVQGATAGLSLLRDEPNYRHSRPTKVMEYLARGVPVVTTPLPRAQALVEASGGGVVVPFDDAAAAADAVRLLSADAAVRGAMAHAGREWVLANADWRRDGPAFVEVLRGLTRT